MDTLTDEQLKLVELLESCEKENIILSIEISKSLDIYEWIRKYANDLLMYIGSIVHSFSRSSDYAIVDIIDPPRKYAASERINKVYGFQFPTKDIERQFRALYEDYIKIQDIFIHCFSLIA